MMIAMSILRIFNFMILDPETKVFQIIRPLIVSALARFSTMYEFKSAFSYHVVLYATKFICLMAGFEAVLTHNQMISILSIIVV
jgi:hypothetical protein